MSGSSTPRATGSSSCRCYRRSTGCTDRMPPFFQTTAVAVFQPSTERRPGSNWPATTSSPAYFNDGPLPPPSRRKNSLATPDPAARRARRLDWRRYLGRSCRRALKILMGRSAAGRLERGMLNSRQPRAIWLVQLPPRRSTFHRMYRSRRPPFFQTTLGSRFLAFSAPSGVLGSELAGDNVGCRHTSVTARCHHRRAGTRWPPDPAASRLTSRSASLPGLIVPSALKSCWKASSAVWSDISDPDITLFGCPVAVTVDVPQDVLVGRAVLPDDLVAAPNPASRAASKMRTCRRTSAAGVLDDGPSPPPRKNWLTTWPIRAAATASIVGGSSSSLPMVPSADEVSITDPALALDKVTEKLSSSNT